MIFVNGTRGVSYHAFEKTPQQWQEIEREQIKIKNTIPKPEPMLETKGEKPKKILWWRILLVFICGLLSPLI